jgi:hypothetical protein
MAEIFVPGRVSGQQYRVRIAGDQPTAQERDKISAFVAQREAEFSQQFEQTFGQAPVAPDYGKMAFGRGLERGLPQTRELFGTALRATGEATGIGALRDFGAGQEEAAQQRLFDLSFRQPARTGLDDVTGIGSALTFAGETLGENIPQLAGSVAGALGATALAKPLTAAGALAAGTAGGAATSFPILFGGNVQRQEQEVEGGGLEERDLGRALISAFGQSALEGVAASILALRPFRAAPGSGLFTRVGVGAGVGVPSEGLTEIGQTMIERAQAGLPIDGPDAIKEYIEAGVAGGILGGTFGGVAGALPGERPAEATPEPITDPSRLLSAPSLALPAPDATPARSDITVDPDVADARGYFEERAAILEFDAQLSRQQAETQAARDTLTYLQSTGKIDSPQLRPTVRALRNKAAVEPETGPPTPPIEAYAEDFGVDLRQAELPIVPSGLAETDVRNSTLEPEAQAEVETTQEVQDAQTAPSGPVEPDPTPDRTGIEGGIAEFDTGEVAIGADPAGAEPSVGGAVGQPVLGPREPDAPTGEQPATLTEPASQTDLADLFDDSTVVAGDEVFTPAQPGPFEAAGMTPMGDGRTWTMDQGGYTYRVRTLPRVSPDDELQRVAARINRTTGEIEPISTNTRVAEMMADMAEAGWQLPASAQGLYPDMARDAISARGIQPAAIEAPAQPATPEAATADQAASLARDALPGQVTGAGPQVIPPPVAPAPRFTSEGAAIDPLVAEAAAAQEAQDKVAAQDAIDAWYETNASLQLKAGRARIAGTAIEPSVMPAADMEAVVALLRKAPKQGKGGRITPERAAFVYFSKSPDTNFVLESIAYDQAQKMSTDYKSREADFRRDTEFETPDEAAFYKGTGAEVAMRAARWIRDNLSEGTRRQVADYTFNKYRPIDYEAASERRDVRRAQARNQQAEVDQIIRDTYGDTTPDADTAADLGFAAEDLRGYDLSSFAGRTEWPSSVHPRVAQLIAAGDIRGALQGLAVTSPNANLRTLAGRLVARVQDTPTQIVPAETMNRIRATMSPETPTLGVETPAGVYVHPMSPDALAAMRREGHEDAAGIVEEFGGQILFNENTPLAPELVMHEAVHAVGDQVLTNKSHPLTRQLDKLRTELLKFMPATNYGLSNVREFFAEGMTNPAFRQQLSYATTEGKPYSAWDNFKNIVRNWMRGLMGRQPIKPDTALTSLDRALDAVLAMNPNEMGAGNVLSASFAPGGMSRIVDDIKARLTTMNADASNRLERFMQDPTVPRQVKSAVAYLGQGAQYTAENAKKYLPSATQLLDLIRQHKGAIERRSNLTRRSIEPAAKDLAKYDSRPEITNAFARVTLLGSAQGVDVIHNSLSHYEGYTFKRNILDPEGNVIRTIESKRYKTEDERNAAIRAYNNNLPDTAPKIARARRGYDSTPEDISIYKALEKDKALLQREAPELIGHIDRLLAVPEAFRKELATALKARIDATVPGDKAKKERVFKQLYEKITADSLLDYYFSLSRSGKYWVTYAGYDVDVGKDDTFKHSFSSLNEQQRALQMLEKQNQRYYARAQELMGDTRPLEEFRAAMESNSKAIPDGIKDILIQENVLPALSVFPYVQSPNDPQVRPPIEMVSRILDTIEGAAELATVTDPKTGVTIDVRDQLIDLVLEASPEKSFLNTFRKRAGTRGFENDITYLTDTITAGDITKNLLQNNLKLANQVTSMEYGAKFAGFRKNLADELSTLGERLPKTDSPQVRTRKADEAQAYYEALVEHSRAPFKVTGDLASGLVGVTYTTTLGFNPSTALLTTMSLPIFYAPYAGGKYGYGKTVAAMSKASRIIAGSGREKPAMRIGENGQLEPMTDKRPIWDISIDNKDYTDPKISWMAPAHKYWEERGMFFNSPIMSELLGENPNLVQKIAGKAAVFQHIAERAVRETALVSTYVMELQNQMGDTRSDINAFIADLEAGAVRPTPEQANAAAAEALTMSEKANGPMLASMGPRASINDFGRVVYLFKRHPLAMMNLMFQTAGRSFAPDSPDRAIARRQLIGMMSMLGATSGLLGLPMMQQVAMFYDAFLREDDEPDFVTEIRSGPLGELGTYGGLDYLLGIRGSDRIGLGGAVYRTGFASDQMPPLFQLAEGFGGPVLGLALKYTAPRTWEHFGEGRYDRLMESVLPSAFANFFRAHRYATDGIENLRGDILVDDIGPFHIGAQALGFMPASYAQRLAVNSLGTKVNNAIETRVRRLLQKRNKAIFEGDMEALRKVNEEIQEFRQRHPGRIDSGTLRSSLNSFNDRTAKTNYGLYVPPRNQAYIESILNDIGSPSAWN